MAVMDVTVVDNSEATRYEARAGDAIAGFAVYRREPEAVVVVHTEVDPAFEGQGIGSILVRGMLDQLRDEGATVRPECPFVRSYVRKHWDAYGAMVTGITPPRA
jgi:predicted GNAT family acetyltransferase